MPTRTRTHKTWKFHGKTPAFAIVDYMAKNAAGVNVLLQYNVLTYGEKNYVFSKNEHESNP